MAISLASTYVSVRPDFTVFRREVRAELTRLAASNDAKIRPVLDPTNFRAQWRVFAATYLRDQTITIRPVLAPGGLSRSAFNARDLAIRVRLDLTAFRAQWRIFAATYLNVIHRIHVHPVISATAVTGMIDAFSDAGGRSGISFGRSFRLKMIAALIVGLLPMLAPLMSILGSLVQASSALFATMPLLIAGAAVSVTALVLVFHNLKDAIEGAFSGTPTEKQAEAYEKLSASAKTFVQILLDTRTKLKGLQTEVQEAFFRPFLAGFRDLVASPVIRQLRAELALIAASAGVAGSEVSSVFADSAKTGQFATLLAGIRSTFEGIAQVVPAMAKMFLTLAVAAQPFVNVLKAEILSSLFQLADLVDNAAKDGRLAKFFNDGLTALQQFVAVVKNLGSIFKSIFDAFTGGSTTALDSLARLTGQFAAFLESAQGQAILGLLAQKLQLIGDVITDILGPIMPLAIKLAQTISGPLSAGIERILPGLNNFITALVIGLTPILESLAPVFDRLVSVVVEFAVLALREMTKHIDMLMPVLQELIAKIGPQLIPVVEAFGEALLALLPLVPLFTQLLLAWMPLLIALVPVFSAMIKVTTFFWEVLAFLITRIINVIAFFAQFAQAGGKVGLALKIVADAIIVAWDAVVSWFRTKIAPSFMKALDDIGGFFAKLGRSLAQAATDIRNVWDAAWAFLRDRVFAPLTNSITQGIPNAFRQGVGFIGAQWDRLKAIARSPVEFFINTVVNRGIVGTFNAVAKWIPGLGTVSEVHPPGFAYGGEYSGPVAGRPSTTDNVIARGPSGEPIGLATGEFVVRATQAQKHMHLLHAINGGMAGYAGGGIIDAITDPAGWVREKVGDVLGRIPGGGRMADVIRGLGTRMVDGLVKLVKDKLLGGASGFLRGLGPGFGTWPASPGAQRGDSGVWRTIVALIMGTGPLSGSFGNAYRPGDPLWHGSGRAVDWMGYNQDALATLLSLLRPLELIHRTNRRDYAYTRGLNRGSFSSGLMQAHRNHIHIAMSGGGLLAKVFDGGGVWKPGEVGVNTGNRNELVVPEGMKVSLSDETIERFGQALARVLMGSAAGTLQLGRTR